MFILLLAIWIILNGQFTIEILIFGLLISAAVCVFISKTMNYSFKKELKRFRLIPLLLLYFVNVIWEIIKANVTVIRMIFLYGKKLQPVVYHFKTDLTSEAARVLLANSITLTPGTITVSLKENELWIHCLDKSLSEGLEDSIFVRLLRRMEDKNGKKAATLSENQDTDVKTGMVK